MKKIILIILIALLGFGIFYFFYLRGEDGLKNETQNTDLPGSSEAKNNTSNTVAGKNEPLRYKKLADDVFSYFLREDGVYEIKNDGKIYLLQGTLEPQEISDYRINNLYEIKTSPDNNYLLASYRDNNDYKFPYFDVKKKIWIPLPDETISADLSPSSKELAYIIERNSGNVLFVKDLIKNQTREIAKINLSEVDLKWMDTSRILFTEKESRTVASRVWVFNLKTKDLQALNANGEKRLTMSWFDNNNFGLKFSEKDQKGVISFINKDVAEISVESISTLPSKCTYLGEKKMVCGVFKEIPAGVFLPDDYMKRKFYSDDDLYLWNPSMGTKSIIKTGIADQVDFDQLSATGTKLYFINRIDKALYQLDIAQELGPRP
ncbi:MAG: hypothetical protein EXS49_02015 [Candidatus Pacebacteria bacterium]|nr:hypothetical protein [Candidatus Paceibacterota bacterium]